MATAGACGDDDAAAPPPASLLDSGAGDGQSNGDAAPPPTRAQYGLDGRPSNTTCLVRPRPATNAGVKFEEVYKNLGINLPMKLMMAPGDPNRFYVAERGYSASSENVTTKVKSFPKSATAATDVSDFATVTVDAYGEGGLLGMAFHPSWQTNHTVFFSYTRKYDGAIDPDPGAEGNSGELVSVISKWTSADNGTTVGNPVEILTRIQPYSNHNGGNIAFGKDGFLYFGLGDGGSGDDPLNSGQTLTTFLGKILRIDVDSGNPYAIPPTNPFASSSGAEKKEIYAYGFRNPFRWSFDRDTGDLWVGDVGQNTWEEIDRVELGGNYGWKTCEGFHKRGSQTELCNTPGLKDPVVEHDRTDAKSITGGVVYRGKAIPSLVGTYVYGDYVTGNVWGIVYDQSGKPSSQLLGQVSNVVDFGEDADGEIYLVSLTNGIHKMVPDTTPAPSAFPEKLSQTGCVDAADPKKPASGLVPYGVRSPLWSDGAEKDRYIAMPDGAKIVVGADGDFTFPIGTVLVKTFRVNGKRVETRLFMRHDDGEWAGYSYEWNDAETDATLLPASKVRDLGGGAAWAYPSRSQCLQCHTQAAGRSLGLEIAQLNGDFVYPSTNRISNQLATLEHVGLFDAPLGDPTKLTKLPEPLGTEPLEARARSYLHSNCSHCHRPNGGGRGPMDFRYANTLAQTQACNQDPTTGNLGVTGAKIVLPGDPSKSIVSLRMHATDAYRMPPLGVRVTDAQGVKVIDDWIGSLKSCP